MKRWPAHECEKIPVLIAGGGPVGWRSRSSSAWPGIPCTLVERRDGAISVPKMSGLSIRSMEFNRRWGIAEKVEARGLAADPSQRLRLLHQHGRATSWRASKIPPMSTRSCPTRPSPAAAARRFSTTRSCWRSARSLPCVTIRHLTSFETFTQDEDGVARDGDATRQTGKSENLPRAISSAATAPTARWRRATRASATRAQGIVANSVNVYFRSRRPAEDPRQGLGAVLSASPMRAAPGARSSASTARSCGGLSVLHADPDFDGDAYMRRLAGAPTSPTKSCR